jgi:hypothetical protein|tara:strand:- start:499 stop:813 length:315 start_codon:yes stop_codon:yes gene_type:complete
MADSVRISEQQALNNMVGAGGYDLVTNATVNSHIYVAITVLVGTEVIADNTASATVTAVSTDTDIWDSLSGVEVPEGCTIYGNWNSVTIGANDTAIVYREVSTT